MKWLKELIEKKPKEYVEFYYSDIHHYLGIEFEDEIVTTGLVSELDDPSSAGSNELRRTDNAGKCANSARLRSPCRWDASRLCLSSRLADLTDHQAYSAVGELARGDAVVAGDARRSLVADARHERNDQPGQEQQHRQDDDQGDGLFVMGVSWVFYMPN